MQVLNNEKPERFLGKARGYEQSEFLMGIPYRTKFTVGQKLGIQLLDKIFDGQNFRHQAKFSKILSAYFLSEKVIPKNMNSWLTRTTCIPDERISFE